MEKEQLRELITQLSRDASPQTVWIQTWGTKRDRLIACKVDRTYAIQRDQEHNERADSWPMRYLKGDK